MQSIEEKAIEMYQNNLDYFKASQPKLLEMLNVLGTAMEKGDYTPQYDLEYLDTYFDVKELSSGNYLYATDSAKISQEFIKSVDFRKDHFCYEGLPVYKSSNVVGLQSDKGKGMEGLYPVMDYYIEHTKENDSMISIDKFMFVGVALGMHLEMIDKKVQAKRYLIIEDNLELFRLSLFTIRYFELAKNSELYFSIADDANLFLSTMEPFLENAFYDNRYLKYTHFPTHSKYKLKQIQHAILSQNFIGFQYKTELSKFLRPLEYLDIGYNILNLGSHIKNDIFNSKPVLLLTAGPSLKKNIQWLKKNHERFIIVAVSATLKTLYKHKIVPTIVTHIDGFRASMSHYKDFPVIEFLKNTLAVLGPFTPSEVKRFFTKENVFFYEEDTEYVKDFGSILAPCVGSFSLLLSLILDAKELYLLGLDLALDQKTGATHASDHVFNKEKDMSQRDEVSRDMNMRDNLLPVKGNFEEKVYTNNLFNFSIQAIQNSILKVKRDDQIVYNLNHGANIYATKPLNIKDVKVSQYDILDKSSILQDFRKVLNKKSVNKLSTDNMKSLKKRLKYSHQIKEKLDNFSFIVSKTNADSYMADILGIFSGIVTQRNRETKNIVQVYYAYFRHLVPIVFDLFNTQEIKNKKQHIQRLNEMIEKEMFEVEGIYSKTLHDFISNENRDGKEVYNNFMVSFYNFDEEKIKNIYTKNAIGFLAVEENLEDEYFINYIKELYVKFPQLTFKAFYFTVNQKRLLENIFSDDEFELESITPINFYDIVEKIEIFISPNANMLVKFPNNILYITYNKELDKKMTIKNNKNNYTNELLEDISNKFNIKIDDSNITKLIHFNFIEEVYSLKLYNENITLFQFRHYDIIKYALSYPKYKRYIMQLTHYIIMKQDSN